MEWEEYALMANTNPSLDEEDVEPEEGPMFVKTYQEPKRYRSCLGDEPSGKNVKQGGSPTYGNCVFVENDWTNLLSSRVEEDGQIMDLYSSGKICDNDSDDCIGERPDLGRCKMS